MGHMIVKAQVWLAALCWTLPGYHTAGISLPASCGVTQGCFHNCNKGSCDFLVTWVHKTGTSNVHILMKAQLHDRYLPQWFALGLSADRTMGDDSVMECTRDPLLYDLADVQQSYNDRHYNIPLYHATLGLYFISGRVYDGILECTFTRQISVGSDDRIFDIDKPWYLLVAFGRIQEGIKQMHDVGAHKPSVSAYRVDLRDHVTVGSIKTSLMLKLHGVLMVFAWMVVASIGMVIARYFRQAWPRSQPCGHLLWFQIHKGLMVLTFLCVAAAFIIVWLEERSFTKMSGASAFQRAHPILGIIIMGLTVLNVVLAFLRPSKLSPANSLFKYVHMFIGAVVYILAILNIGIGVTLDKAGAREYSMWIVVGFAAYLLVFDFILEVHDGYLIKSGRKLQYEMGLQQVRTLATLDYISSYSQSPPGTTFKTCLLSVHVFVCVAVGAACILMILI